MPNNPQPSPQDPRPKKRGRPVGTTKEDKFDRKLQAWVSSKDYDRLMVIKGDKSISEWIRDKINKD